MDNYTFDDLMEMDQSLADVQYHIGLCYFNGSGVDKDPARAQEWLTMAAAQGHPEALSLLESAQSSANAEALSQDTLPVWCQRAEEGDGEAQYKVAVYFLDQAIPGTEGDVDRYLSSAAAQGHGDACLLLAKRLLRSGQAAQAIQHLRNASDCGVAEASKLLGDCYFAGTGVDRDLDQAEQYYNRAASFGGNEALVTLAVRYTMGQGVPVSPARALALVRRAEENGMADARAVYDANCEKERAVLREKEEREAQQAEQQRKEAILRMAQQATQDAHLHAQKDLPAPQPEAAEPISQPAPASRRKGLAALGEDVMTQLDILVKDPKSLTQDWASLEKEDKAIRVALVLLLGFVLLSMATKFLPLGFFRWLSSLCFVGLLVMVIFLLIKYV